MTGRTLNWYWKAMWACVSPLLIIGLFVFYLSDYIVTGTLQYQAWDASQVSDVSRLTQSVGLSPLTQGTVAVVWGNAQPGQPCWDMRF
jgi:hypothetical protein